VTGTDSRSNPTRRPEKPAALGVAAVALAGMAYCHIKDVGLKFEEDVYYMAILFCCNIALSLWLIPGLIWGELEGSARARRMLWGAAGALAAVTSRALCGAALSASPRWTTTSASGTRSGSPR
jgi:hypothetical protein